MSPRNEQLNRECSLSTDNGDYVIVGSAAFVPEEPHVLICREPHTPGRRFFLQVIFFFLSLKAGAGIVF